MILDLSVFHPVTIKGSKSLPQGWGIPTPIRDDDLLNRICDYFQTRLEEEGVYSDSRIWDTNVERQKGIVTDLKERNLRELHDTFRNIFSSPLTHGTGAGDEYFNRLIMNENYRYSVICLIFDKLLSIMESTGLQRTFNQEEYYYVPHYYNVHLNTHPDVLLERIQERYGDLTAPKYSGGQFGLITKYGLYAERDLISLGLALMIADKYKDRSISICEIGGGTGHLAYYLHKLGFKNISIVDLPTISVSQMYFLETNLGNNDIKLLSPSQFDGKYDLVLNVDSLIEMSIETAKDYLKLIKENAGYFISVNSETDEPGFFKVPDICNMEKVSRNLFWFRRGYVIEEYK
jgi:2-polyprenyl-3-methyl-5-hydroxy-6-metoxy-1,4-benzoquinol methylase